ncbi:MAG TPA: hypothetical protein VE200_04800 [Xanthobacteraceae bacterium]|nr:hypothetical protein [Xanthobacteraceae bacterium]
MSDTAATTVAPAPSAPAPQAPAPAHEVPINQNPVHSPNPISQAPEKAPNPADSRRDAIQRAFDRANRTPEPKAAPPKAPPAKAADAKPGHNNPPEETPRLDLKRRPDDQPRDRGRFAPRQDATNAPQNVATNGAANVAPGQQQARPAAQLPPTAPYAAPPGRFAERAKSEWAHAPESVRGEVHRMQDEFVKAYKVYKNDFDEMSKIRHFHKMATDHGTDLNTSLTNYTGMEQKLRADPVAGLDMIVNNLNLRTPEGEKIGFRDIAYHVLSQSPDQLRQLQMGNQQHAASQQIGALHSQIQHLQQTVQQMHTDQQFVQTRSAIDVFADSHPRLDELGEVIKREIALGFDLPTAYRRAELLHPTTQAPQTRTPSAQTRPVDRSISGSHDVGPSNGTSRRPRQPSGSPREAVQNAINRVNGRL